MSDRDSERRGLVGVAGRTAVALLRTTGRRANLGGLHLPISLHPHRHEAIAVPEEARGEEAPSSIEQSDTRTAAPPPVFTVEVRALRSKLAAAERRNARLRSALQRQRLAMARAGETQRQPRTLIDHLVLQNFFCYF